MEASVLWAAIPPFAMIPIGAEPNTPSQHEVKLKINYYATIVISIINATFDLLTFYT
ncbi:hypothetical protein QFZ20_003924 [Flavobacterium sp. W4I14]|nr:hypothetical protein [Flavobacterium sp. W4I14]